MLHRTCLMWLLFISPTSPSSIYIPFCSFPFSSRSISTPFAPRAFAAVSTHSSSLSSYIIYRLRKSSSLIRLCCPTTYRRYFVSLYYMTLLQKGGLHESVHICRSAPNVDLAHSGCSTRKEHSGPGHDWEFTPLKTVYSVLSTDKLCCIKSVMKIIVTSRNLKMNLRQHIHVKEMCTRIYKDLIDDTTEELSRSEACE